MLAQLQHDAGVDPGELQWSGHPLLNHIRESQKTDVVV